MTARTVFDAAWQRWHAPCPVHASSVVCVQLDTGNDSKLSQEQRHMQQAPTAKSIGATGQQRCRIQAGHVLAG